MTPTNTLTDPARLRDHAKAIREGRAHIRGPLIADDLDSCASLLEAARPAVQEVDRLLRTAPHFEGCETSEPTLSGLIYRYYRAHFEDRDVADGLALNYIDALRASLPSAQQAAAQAESAAPEQEVQSAADAWSLGRAAHGVGTIWKQGDVHDAFVAGAQWQASLPPPTEPCPAASMDERACTNRHQCFEPCGELGKSAKHARVVRVEAQQAAPTPTEQPTVDEIVNRFLSWLLPGDVCVDPCAMALDYPGRTGTTLLTASQARQMFEYVLGGTK